MSPSYIAVLDHQHLDNSVFLSAFARSLSQHGSSRKGIVVHGDSPYTDRLIQTGIMRADARLRAIKDLNRRLIGLFADQGVSTIGVHGYQKEMVRVDGDQDIELDQGEIEQLHSTPHLLLSCLAAHGNETDHIPLPSFVSALAKTYTDAEILLFSMKEEDEILTKKEQVNYSWQELPESFKEGSLPEEFREYKQPVTLTTATDFANWPDLNNATKIQ